MAAAVAMLFLSSTPVPGFPRFPEEVIHALRVENPPHILQELLTIYLSLNGFRRLQVDCLEEPP